MAMPAATATTPSHAILGDLKARLWRNVLANAVWAFGQAEESLRRPDRHAHFSAKAGWWRASPYSGNRIPSETAVSEALVDEIDRLRRIAAGQGVDRLEAMGFGGFGDLCFSVEQPRVVKTGIGDRSKPTDIRVYRTGATTIDLRIEAKTLLSNADIKAEYLSERGMMRFCDPAEPYTIEPYGGMLAYTVSQTPKEWGRNIRKALVDEFGNDKVLDDRFHEDQAEIVTCELDRPACADPDGGLSYIPAGPVRVFHMAIQLKTEPAPTSLPAVERS